MLAFRELEINDAELILNWRTNDRVTRFMSSDIVYDLDAQKRWLSNSFSRPDYYHWVIQYSGKDVGLMNIVDWKPAMKETYWGYYIGDETALGMGSIVPPCLYKFAFDVLGVETIKAAILSENVRVIQLHKLQGYELEPTNDQVIHKNGCDVQVVCMTLCKKAFIKKGFSRLAVELPISKWEGAKEILARG